MQPKITCSILCYNYGRFLAKAIDSCLNQTVDNGLYEVLVIDDGSTDNTPEVCALYGDRIRVSRTENLGFSQSLYRGISEANGEYVAYLDADDWWADNKLELILPGIDRGALTIMHPLIEVDERGMPLGNIGACGNTSSICIHKAAALTLLPATSEIFCHPLIDIKKGEVIDVPLGYYRIHDKSMTDRTPAGHTEFFAKTNHVTADRLFELSINKPFWAVSESQVNKLALWYRAEGYIKDFQRITELRKKKDYFHYWIRMLRLMIKSRRWFSAREFRLTGRAILHFLKS